MAELQLIDHATLAETPYAAPSCTARGAARSQLAMPEGFSQWILTGTLEAGAEIEWDKAHGDEAVYVVAGEAEVDGRAIGAGGAVVVEGGARPRLRATRTCRVVHVGSTVSAPGGAKGVHVHGPDGVAVVENPERALNVVWFADSRCEGCDIAFFKPSARGPYVSPSHSHSQDELIHILWGDLQVGRDQAGAGMTMAVPADRRYGFRSSKDWGFLNYRRGQSYTTGDPKAPPIRDGYPQ